MPRPDPKSPWPLLRDLQQGDIEQTALVDTSGRVVARVTAPPAYEGDLRTAVENGDLTAQIVSASTSAPDLYGALKALVTFWDEGRTHGFKTLEPYKSLDKAARAALARADGAGQ